MRLAHVQARLEQQLALADLISNSYNNLTSRGAEGPTPARVRVRMTVLEEEWERFTIVHNALEISIRELSDDDRATVHNHAYFTENLFSETHESYLESLAKLNELIDTDQRTVSVPSTASPAPLPSPTCHHPVRLPRIDLPKFNGTPADWLSFKDLFQSLVLNSPILSSVEKLQYLKTSLVGKAAQLLKHTALAGDNLASAWESLISFYENKRLLVNIALQSLLDLKRLTTESAADLEKLYTDVMQIYRSLEILQRPVSSCDDFFVFIVTQKLDPETVKAWEHKLGAQRDPPTWGQLTEFLVTRLRSLQAVERSRSGKPKSDHRLAAIKSHYQGTPGSMYPGTSTSSACVLCKSNHTVSACPQYTSKSMQQRLDLIRTHKLCYNCLGIHRVANCRSRGRCGKCGFRHHTSIHQPELARKRPDSDDSSKGKDLPSQPTAPIALHTVGPPTLVTTCVLLATAQVLVFSSTGMTSKVRALIDQGSEVSLISERLAQRLRLARSHRSIPLIGVGAQASNRTRGLVSFKVKPHFASSFDCSITAYVLKQLTTTVPSRRPVHSDWPHLHGLQLADPNFQFPGSIDLLLGADVYSQFICNEIVRGDPGTPLAQLSQLGWIISGPTGTPRSSEESHSYHISVNDDLYHLISQLWALEEIPSSRRSALSIEDQMCEDFYRTTHSRDISGRYTVRLPFKQPTGILGSSKEKAKILFTRLWKRFYSDESYHQLYSTFISEYVQLRHMMLVPDHQPEPDQVYYLPHHGVLSKNNVTTRLRVVFNGSSPTSSGLSLNDLLLTGEKLQANLFDVLVWFRRFCYVFSTDIEKMFRQINVHSEDWKYQRILWMKDSGCISTYELTTVTYGLGCAPFLALRTLAQLVEDEGSKFPLAVPVLNQGRYVDDLFGGADTVEQAQEIVQQVTSMCMAGGFPLKKWSSNDPEVLTTIPVPDRRSTSTLYLENEELVQSLGLSWDLSVDTFQFNWTLQPMRIITKRTVLSTIAKFFDPLGLLSPIVIRAKIFVQELWTLNLGWDDPLPSTTLAKWTDFTDSFQDVHLLTFPRWLGFISAQPIELHGFCDASQQATAAVVYIRSISENGDVVTRLVCAKTRVAPLKRLTIPRLELSGAVLLTKLVSHVSRSMGLEQFPIFLWIDSSVAYTWINSHPSKWKDFVHNRVCFIQETLPQATWRFVPGIDNPADYATRGLTPRQLSDLPSWWSGPSWLSQQCEAWPCEIQAVPSHINLEQRPAIVATNLKATQRWDLVDRYSSLTKLLRITVICQRVAACMRRKPNSSLTTPLTTEELTEAETFWTKVVQHWYFDREIEVLSRGQLLPRSNPLIRLTPFLDSTGILRVGGRLQAAPLTVAAKHPAILPKNSPFSTLVILDAHQRMLHGGTQVTLSYIRNKFWIVGGRTIVRSHLFKCVRCTRFRQKRAQQLMGQLPPERLTPTRPFLNTGIDYAGPVTFKTWKGKNARTYKAYIALFVCHSTSAVHIELVTDYSAETFIAAFKRFTARRGICATLMSDCGTTLKGADAELKKLFSESSKESGRLATLLSNDGTQWKFIPPSAPHFGGKWEAGVKSVKYHLKRVIGEALLTYEEMSTLLTQIEAILNSRPLCPLTEDPDDLNVLTPGHFIMGCAPSLIPEPSLQEVRTGRLSRWQLIRQMSECFWTRWSTECLHRYLSIYKWNHRTPSLSEGSMVLVVDERYPPSKWPLGRVIRTYPGKDGLVRVVTVRTQTSELKRPIVKLCPLPILDHPE